MNITVEKLEQIESERQQTMGDANFQKWMVELNVSKSYVESKLLLQGNDMTKQYDYSKYRYRV